MTVKENKILEQIRNYMSKDNGSPYVYLKEEDNFFNVLTICPDCQEIEVSLLTPGTIPVCCCGAEMKIVFRFQSMGLELENNKFQYNEWFWEKIVYTVNDFDNFVEQHS